jgi:hypothetical protein
MSPCDRFELRRLIFFDSYQNATNDGAPEQEQHRASVGEFECRLGGAHSVSLGRSQDRPAPLAFLRSGDDPSDAVRRVEGRRRGSIPRRPSEVLRRVATASWN